MIVIEIVMILFFSLFTTSCTEQVRVNYPRCVVLDLDTKVEVEEKSEGEYTLPEEVPQKPKEPMETETTIPPTNEKEIVTPSKKEDVVMMTISEIKEHNKKIAQKTTTLSDIAKINYLSKEDIKKHIESSSMPKMPKYDGDEEVSEEQIQSILENRNIAEIEEMDSPRRGIVVSRTNMKSFPTDVKFFKTKGATNFDQIQETEITVNTPALILHESKDGSWYFIKTQTYSGWVKKSDVAIASLSNWNYFDDSSSFVVVTSHSIMVDGKIIDMGVRLPVKRDLSSEVEVDIPIKTASNLVSKKAVLLDKSSISLGYLPYTKENVLAQAQKYMDTPYSWGGMDKGVDCSSFIMNIYSTFGFVFPRNTSSQNSSVGEVITLSEKNSSQKLEIFSKQNDPVILYQPGHTMLYIGVENGKHYIIHASGSEMKVTKTQLENSTYLKNIDRIVKIAT